MVDDLVHMHLPPNVTITTADGTPYRSSDDNDTVHVRPEHVEELRHLTHAKSVIAVDQAERTEAKHEAVEKSKSARKK